MAAEGWYLDPFKLHAERWFSDGTPTNLVRDGGVDSYDPPPSAVAVGPLIPVIDEQRADGADLLRADAIEPKKPGYRRALIDLFERLPRA